MPRIRCRCSHVLSFEYDQAGKRAQCPKCSAILVLPSLKAYEAPNAPVILDGEAAAQPKPETPLAGGLSHRPPSPEEEAFAIEERLAISSPPQDIHLSETAPSEPAEAPKRYLTSSYWANEDETPPNFFLLLIGAFAYPLRLNNLIALIVGVVTFGATFFLLKAAWFYRFFPFASAVGDIFVWIVCVVLGGYVAGYFLSIIHRSASGDPSAPDWPDLTDYMENAVKPFFLVAALGAVSLGPAFAYGHYVKDGSHALYTALLGAGLFYMPMGMLCIALRGSMMALNPAIAIRAIASVPLRYVIVWILVVVSVFLQDRAQSLVEQHVQHRFLGIVLRLGVGFYFLLVLGRTIGILYHSGRNKLRWLGG